MSPLALLGLAALCLLVYANTLPNDLVFDDAELIRNHPGIRNPLDLGAVFGSRYWGPIIRNDVLYRPVTSWTLAANFGVNRAIGVSGDSPFGYHLVNLALHAAVTMLLLGFFIRAGLSPPAGWIGAALFAVLPIHTEAVAAVLGRADLLALLFGLLFLREHLDRRRAYLAAPFLLAALLSKESAAALAAIAVLIDLARRPEKSRRSPAAYPAYAVAGVAWALWRAHVIGETKLVILPLDNPLVQVGPVERIVTALSVQGRYLALQIAPLKLSSDYSLNQVPVVRGAPDAGALLFVLVLAFGIAAGIRWRARSPFLPIAVGGYILSFLPVSNLWLVIGTIMGERLAYAPSLFLCGLAGQGAAAALGRYRRAVPVLTGVVLGLFALMSVARNGTWATEERFYRTQLRHAPASAKANYNTGRLEQNAGRSAAAIAAYRKAVAIWPDYAEALNNLGAVLRETGNLSEAVEVLQRATAAQPYYPYPYFNLGQIYQARGDSERALSMYEQAVRLKPDYAFAYTNMAGIHAEKGELARAESLLLQAIQADPSYETARRNLAMIRQARSAPSR